MDWKVSNAGHVNAPFPIVKMLHWKRSDFSRRFMKWNAAIIVTFRLAFYCYFPSTSVAFFFKFRQISTISILTRLF